MERDSKVLRKNTKQIQNKEATSIELVLGEI